MAMSYYRLKEYQRAEHLTRNCESPPVQFLHYYCKYMAGESKKTQPELFGEAYVSFLSVPCAVVLKTLLKPALIKFGDVKLLIFSQEAESTFMPGSHIPQRCSFSACLLLLDSIGMKKFFPNSFTYGAVAGCYIL